MTLDQFDKAFKGEGLKLMTAVAAPAIVGGTLGAGAETGSTTAIAVNVGRLASTTERL